WSLSIVNLLIASSRSDERDRAFHLCQHGHLGRTRDTGWTLAEAELLRVIVYRGDTCSPVLAKHGAKDGSSGRGKQ
ncbi:MAG: hypothetical protein LQ341_001709, partial [Variospora aurantia]